MRATAPELGDNPDLSTWEEPYRTGMHALLIIGGATTAAVEILHMCNAVKRLASHALTAEEFGDQLTVPPSRVIEPFGFLDGISQPIFVQEDLPWNKPHPRRYSRFDPSESLRHILIHDPHSNGFGTYLIYRKLEQDIVEFERRLGDLKNNEVRSARPPNVRVRAEEFLAGRSRAGHSPMAATGGTSNDFSYAKDRAGTQCPLTAHARLMNPRTRRRYGRTAFDIVLARRGQAYGPGWRGQPILVEAAAQGKPIDRAKITPSGLFFLGMNASNAQQFVKLQQRIGSIDVSASSAKRPKGGFAPTGDNMLSDRGLADHLPGVHVGAAVVTLRGGEFLFIPSIPFLRSI
jgi:deferrochelatase/peroxidase EfeB